MGNYWLLKALFFLVTLLGVSCSSTSESETLPDQDSPAIDVSGSTVQEDLRPLDSPARLVLGSVRRRGVFLHQDPADDRAFACVNGGDSQPVVCFPILELDIDLSDPANGAADDQGFWRIYGDVVVEGDFDGSGLLTNVTTKSPGSFDEEAPSIYQCPDPVDGQLPTRRQARDALRDKGLPLVSWTGGNPNQRGVFEVTLGFIDGQRFDQVCDQAPSLRITSLALLE